MDNLLLKSIADSVQELTEDEQVSILLSRHRLWSYGPYDMAYIR